MKPVMIAMTCVFAASAAMASVAGVDADGDGVASFAEMTAVYPTLTEDGFGTVDTNGDGVVDGEEMEAAISGGLIPDING
ncbi:MAG: hypothetical protein ABJ327_13985 [Litoreibacter sp.]